MKKKTKRRILISIVLVIFVVTSFIPLALTFVNNQPQQQNNTTELTPNMVENVNQNEKNINNEISVRDMSTENTIETDDNTADEEKSEENDSITKGESSNEKDIESIQTENNNEQ